MRPVERTFGQSDTCLKYFDYKGKAVVVDETITGAVTENGRTILKAGTPYPSNDASCLGYLLHDYDVTNGEQSATYIFEGSIDNKILEANEIVVSAEAKAATPRVTFFD